VTKWEPLKDLMSLQERMNRLFEETFSHGFQDTGTEAWYPAADIVEKQDTIIIKLEIPEVGQQDIDISMEGNVLTVKGKRQLEEGANREDYHRLERPYGRFSRSFKLPAIVDHEKITASHKDGILRLVLPKKEESTPKQIKVEVGE
jgi:HSP20 family protein